ncbi:MAG: Fe-S cluster assembly sulfur transfer protein SufU [Burkholderiales bacterium]|nr:SUF system NifU family Fe-S cluster assembly protein [Burkholderiales bacterium]MDQ3195411.1 SUF system NifU family Fe-S cluster assembly protein [Pseudomonadota bacterium]
MSDLRELYQEVIFDHNRKPRNFRKLDAADRLAEGFNPLCGDQITVYVKFDQDVISDVSFEGSGCAISTASASLMTEALKGKTEAEARALFENFHSAVTSHGCAKCGDLGKLKVLAGVAEYPSRVKCATLAWHTFTAALDQKDQPVTTE